LKKLDLFQKINNKTSSSVGLFCSAVTIAILVVYFVLLIRSNNDAKDLVSTEVLPLNNNAIYVPFQCLPSTVPSIGCLVGFSYDSASPCSGLPFQLVPPTQRTQIPFCFPPAGRAGTYIVMHIPIPFCNLTTDVMTHYVCGSAAGFGILGDDFNMTFPFPTPALSDTSAKLAIIDGTVFQTHHKDNSVSSLFTFGDLLGHSVNEDLGQLEASVGSFSALGYTNCSSTAADNFQCWAASISFGKIAYITTILSGKKSDFELIGQLGGTASLLLSAMAIFVSLILLGRPQCLLGTRAPDKLESQSSAMDSL